MKLADIPVNACIAKLERAVDLFSDIQQPSLPFTMPAGIEYSYGWDTAMQAFIVQVPNGELIFSESFFNRKISDRAVEYFQENDSYDWASTHWQLLSGDAFAAVNFTHINWTRDHIHIYGKRIPLPRLTAWYGDPGKSYSYSGITSAPNKWNKGLLYIKAKIEQATALTFNSVLLNWYRNGDDHMGWHADDETELGDNPVIASVNFGATRDFVLRRIDDPTQKIVIPLQHGSLLVMRGELQHYWQHSLPKRKAVNSSRFNLTFRTVL